MRKPVPILLTVRELGQGGCERDLTKLAIHIDRSKFEPHVGCFRPDGIRIPELKQAGVPIIHIPVRSFRSTSAISGARIMGDYLRRNGIQLIHAFDVPMNIFTAPVGRFYGAPVIMTSQLSYRALVPGWQRVLLRVADRVSHAVVVNCLAMKRHMEEDEKARPDLLQLCYNGIDTSVFHPGAEEQPRCLAGAEVVIGVVCALRPEKDLTTLVKAFAKVARENAGLRLVIVGSGPSLDELRRAAGEMGIVSQCVFEPATSNVATWLRGMDVFVLPSVSEALSNALMEAMACGCAAIASRVGGNPELVEEGKTGLLFEARDVEGLAAQLRRMIADPSFRKSVGANAARFIAENFTVETYIKRMEDVYSELLGLKAEVGAYAV